MDRRIMKEKAKERINNNLDVVTSGCLIILLLSSFPLLHLLHDCLRIFLVIFVLLLPLYVGQTRIHFNMVRKKQGNISDILPFVDGRGYGRELLGMIIYIVCLSGWTILLVIPGIYKAFAYAMTLLILQDPEFSHLNGIQAISKSREIMNGHKLEYFDLLISFVGWYLLVVITAGLGILYVGPYVQQAKAEFYMELKKENN